jgi:hypothetical protein
VLPESSIMAEETKGPTKEEVLPMMEKSAKNRNCRCCDVRCIDRYANDVTERELMMKERLNDQLKPVGWEKIATNLFPSRNNFRYHSLLHRYQLGPSGKRLDSQI